MINNRLYLKINNNNHKSNKTNIINTNNLLNINNTHKIHKIVSINIHNKTTIISLTIRGITIFEYIICIF